MSSHGVLRIGSVISALACFVLIAGCGSDSSQTDWVLREEPAGNSLLIDVAIGNSCNFFDRIDVHETQKRVEIESFSTFSLSGGDGCADLLKVEQDEIQLDEPLGDRKLEGCHPPGPNVLSRDVQDCRTVLPRPTVTP